MVQFLRASMETLKTISDHRLKNLPVIKISGLEAQPVDRGPPYPMQGPCEPQRQESWCSRAILGGCVFLNF